jgi:hypothetical protein
VRTPASLFNTDFEDANLHRRQRVTHHQVSTTRERPARGITLFNGTPRWWRCVVGTFTVTIGARSS